MIPVNDALAVWERPNLMRKDGTTQANPSAKNSGHRVKALPPIGQR
jgi:hypothetical protein